MGGSKARQGLAAVPGDAATVLPPRQVSSGSKASRVLAVSASAVWQPTCNISRPVSNGCKAGGDRKSEQSRI